MSSSRAAAPTCTQLELARIFRVTPRTIQRWHEDGLPREGEGADTTYHMDKVMAWAQKRERDRLEVDEGEGGPNYDEAKARKTLAQAELAEFDVLERRKVLIHVDEVESKVRGPIEQVDAALRNAPARYAAELASKSKVKKVAVAMRLIESIIERIRADLREVLDGERANAA